MGHEAESSPFGKVVKAEFDLRGLGSMKHAAHIQYKLMLLEPVIRAHVDFPKKSMQIVYTEPGENTRTILKTIQPIKAVQSSRRAIDYDSIVDKSFHKF